MKINISFESPSSYRVFRFSVPTQEESRLPLIS